MNTLGSRIKAARENKKLLQSELAKLVSVKSSGVISNWENDINKPDAEKIVALCNALEVTPSYLLDYNGEKQDADADKALLISYYDRLNEEGKKELIHQIKLLLQIPEFTMLKTNMVEYRLIAYYNKIAAAGHAIGSFSDLMQGVIKIIDTPESSNADFAIGVLGESMEPTYCDGDIVLVKKQYDLNPGEIGIFQKDNEIYIKEMREDGLYSHNPKYAPIKDESEVRVLGKVIGKAALA